MELKQRADLVLAFRTIKLDVNPAQVLFIENIINAYKENENITMSDIGDVIDTTNEQLQIEVEAMEVETKEDK